MTRLKCKVLPCVQVDYLMSRLSSLEGKIGGTEMQLNLELDHRSALTMEHTLYMRLFAFSVTTACRFRRRRNELQALDLAITAVMSMFAFVSMIGESRFNVAAKCASPDLSQPCRFH